MDASRFARRALSYQSFECGLVRLELASIFTLKSSLLRAADPEQLLVSPHVQGLVPGRAVQALVTGAPFHVALRG
ncbi:hypothetical protein MPLSOD_330075 [Mesorhizobium sp. SOD10]|nr:hypothetical protein MPLSOD_330075 [Mesorhizobium sp. SOD10]